MNMKQTTLHRRSINILQFLRLSNPPRYKINTPLLLGFFFYFFAAYHVSEAFARRYSVKNVFLKISQNSPENTCARVSFLINLQSSPLFIEHLQWLLLTPPLSPDQFLRVFIGRLTMQSKCHHLPEMNKDVSKLTTLILFYFADGLLS